MKVLLLIALLAAQESDLVKAANDAKAKRSGKATKVITNADVKKSKSKLGTTNVAPTTTTTSGGEGAAAPLKTMSIDQLYRARRDAGDHIATLEKKVADLDKSLNLIEQSFYAENDPNYRDDVIQKRFEQTKRQLADARKELADARDALAALGAPK